MIGWTDGKENKERKRASDVLPAEERRCSNSTGRDDSYTERIALGLTGSAGLVLLCVCVCVLPGSHYQLVPGEVECER